MKRQKLTTTIIILISPLLVLFAFLIALSATTAKQMPVLGMVVALGLSLIMNIILWTVSGEPHSESDWYFLINLDIVIGVTVFLMFGH